MVIEVKRGNIFDAPHTHIVFAINTEGANDAGFAGLIASRDWPELAHIGPTEMGTIYTRNAEGRTYHAIACHSLGSNGWANTPTVLEKCLNDLDIPDDEVIGIVLIGAGMIGQMMGADAHANVEAMKRSTKKFMVYYV